MAPDVSDPDLQEVRTKLVRQAERIGQTYPLPLEVHKSVDNSYAPLSGPGDASLKLWRVCVKVTVVFTEIRVTYHHFSKVLRPNVLNSFAVKVATGTRNTLVILG
jgi:hypothetical protein